MITISHETQHNDLNLKTYLKYSLAAHFFIVVFFTMKVLIFPDSDLDYQSAIKVDIVDLPDKILPNQLEQTPNTTENQIPEPTKEAQPSEAINDSATTTKEPEVVLEKKETKTQDKKSKALDKIKQMSAIEKIKQQLENEKKAEKAKTILKGNILSAGTQLTGINQLQHDNYKGLIDRHVKSYWSLPQWLAGKDLGAQIRVKLNKDGSILNYQIIKSSGNPTYDENVIETVKSASPFPPPPEKFIDIMAERGIILGFPE